MYDVIVIGAGPAGISAAIYAKRTNLNAVVLYSGISNLERATKIDNYYGFQNGISGKELFDNGIKQAENLGIDIKNEEVVSISQIIGEYALSKQNSKQNLGKAKDLFIVKTVTKEYTGKTVIIATGNRKNEPDIKGIKEFEGRGISYCAICDAFFYRNKDIAVIGSRNFALSEIEILKRVANKVYVLTNGDTENFEVITKKFENDLSKNSNASSIIKKEEKDNNEYNNTNSNNVFGYDDNKMGKKIIIINKKIKEITGKNKVNGVTFEDNSTIQIDGAFIALGEAGANDFAKTLGILTKSNGNIIINQDMMTNVNGVFACGNITGGLLQVNKSAYDGAKAGLAVSRFLKF